MGYIVYVDEAGDGSLQRIEPSFPVLVLAFCLFSYEEYAALLAPALLRLKFKYWGHAQTVLHEREIRKQEGPFVFLTDQVRRDEFMSDLNDVVAGTPFTVVAAVVDKSRHAARYADPWDPYMLALKFGLERCWSFLAERGLAQSKISFVFESRGSGNDAHLKQSFDTINQGDNEWRAHTRFECLFSKKFQNDLGVQVADLIARPIGRHVMSPTQPNRAFDVIEPKFRRSGTVYHGYGLKVFPDVPQVPERWLGR